MLFRPLGFLVCRLVGAGSVVDSVLTLQVLSAMFGALGLGFVYVALERLSENPVIAIWTTFALGTSWSYWTLSTDVSYFTLASMMVAASLALFVYAQSMWSFVACGFLTGLSILACQANVVLLPALAAAILIDRSLSFVRKAHRVMLLCGTAGIFVSAIFVSVGIFMHRARNASELLRWMSTHDGTTLPMYGAWTFSRLLVAPGTVFRSVAGIDQLTTRIPFQLISLGGMPGGWIAPVGCLVSAGALIALFWFKPSTQEDDRRTGFGLFVLFAAYVPFVVWWEPIEPRWFVMPNVFLAALTAVAWKPRAAWRPLTLVLPTSFAFLGMMNLFMSVAPGHFETSASTQMAACVAGQMQKEDLFLATEWNWAGYLHGVHHRDVISFLDEVAKSPTRGDAVDAIKRIAADYQERGGHVFIMALRSYPIQHMTWLSEQTGLSANDLRAFSGPEAFTCGSATFLRLDRQTPMGQRNRFATYSNDLDF